MYIVLNTPGIKSQFAGFIPFRMALYMPNLPIIYHFYSLNCLIEMFIGKTVA